MVSTSIPKNPMASTWRDDKSQWGFHHYVVRFLNLWWSDPKNPAPVHPKTDKVPFLPEWKMHRYILAHAFVPVILHQAAAYVAGRNLGPYEAFGLYFLSYTLAGARQIKMLRGLGSKYGYLDGDKHERDGVPDTSVRQVMQSLTLTTLARTSMITFLSYRGTKAPLQHTTWLWLPVELSLYSVVLDFWFYWYHRLMHEVEWLWKYHRTHHLTKHPNPLLTLFADIEQEVADIAIIPLLTFFSLRIMGFPMGFYEFWVCQQYITYNELAGHSGLRIYSTPPTPINWLLTWLGMELTLEDHDLHHRQGWKSSGNYGKQTRVWDRLFGTLLPRIESTLANVDWNNSVQMPWY